MSPAAAINPAPPRSSGASTPDDLELTDLLRAFRQLELQHGRVMHHESTRLGMGATDIRGLLFIGEAGDDGTSPKFVADFLELSTGATTSLVDRLVDSGTVVRRPHPSDRRSVVLVLTDVGRDVVVRVAEVYREALSDSVAEADRHALAATFRTVAASLAATSPCAG